MSQTDAAGNGATPKTTKPPSLFKTLDPAALNFRPSESSNNPAGVHLLIVLETSNPRCTEVSPQLKLQLT